jgi:N-methylhydantoinase B
MNRLGIDIGASTVDLALSVDGLVRTLKLSRNGDNSSAEILNAIAVASDRWSLPQAALDEIRIGSTGALNLILQRDVAKIGLLSTRGFADTLALARQNRVDLYDPVARSPSPRFLVSPSAIHEIDGRLGPDGRQIEPLALDQIRDAALSLQRAGAQAIAVCFLFAHLDAAHENACAEALAEAVPDIPVVLSHQVDPYAREYERTVSACLEAALVPSQRAALDTLERSLRDSEFAGRLSFAEARGYLQSSDTAKRRVTSLILGGPAAATLTATELMNEAGITQAIAIDAGSTSTDIVALTATGASTTTHGVVATVPLRIPMADIHSIALGGGSRLSGFSPHAILGPNCAIDTPTVTDALIGLRLMQDTLAPGSHERIAHAANGAGLEPEALCRAIRDAVTDRIAETVIRYAAGRNIDPAATALIASGGLGQVLACDIAERTGARDVVIGHHGAVAGALGLLYARSLDEEVRSLNIPLDQLSHGDLARFEEGSQTARSDAQIVVALAPNAFMHPVELPLPSTAPSVADVRAAFDAFHLERFGAVSREPGYVFSIARRAFGPAPENLRHDDTQRAAPVAPAHWQPCHAGSFFRFQRGTDMAPLRIETLQMRLNAIAQSMQETLFRTAVSAVVREGNDAAAALLSVDGELIALSDAIPLLLGALDGSTRAILHRFPAHEMRDGDLYLMNDPFLGGTHLPDLTVVRPVFAEDRLIGFAASILHHQDIGGMRAGSVPPDAVEIFQEGLRLPPTLMGRGDQIDRHIVDLIHANSRAPSTVLGDLSSQIRAAAEAAHSLQALARECGAGALVEGIGQCLASGEALARTAIAAMAPGPHAARESLDPTPGLPPVAINLALSCASGKMRIDFDGTSPQVAAPINCVRSGPFAASFYSLLSALGPTVFRNGGVVRCIDLELPQGCAINASAPAAVNARMGIVRATTSALLQALAKALPAKMPAANSGMSYVLAFSGIGADGARFIVTEIIAGGAGGGPDNDGAPGISTDVGNAMNMPAEALESQIPVRLIEASVRRGSGGAGQFRGGDGISRTYLALQDGIQVSLRGERFQSVPLGLLGGGSPRPSAATIILSDGSVKHLSTRSVPVLNAGDRLIVESCGGAGYGIPATEMPS